MAHLLKSSSKSRRLSLHKPWIKQKGAALILIAFILGLGAAVYVLKTYNADAARARQDEKTYKALAEAKQALIAWAVNHPNTPGLMPYPDRNGDLNYDDTSDCYASNINFAPNFTIGRLPLFKSDPNCVNAKSIVTSGLAGDFRDSGGERLWYEVSQNLLHDYKNNGDPDGTSPIINPSIINTPTNGWFVVVDRSGKVLSDRVAAVIIAPGAPVGNQDRSSGIADANQYLDKIVMASGKNYKNYTYYDSAIPLLKQEFIVGDDLRVVSRTDTTYKNQSIEPYYFNDKLVYITIDELMYALEKRVLQEAKNTLNNYYAANGYYPFASGLGLTANQNQCVQGNLRGLLPVNVPSAHACNCSASSRTCNCSFSVLSSISFTRNSGNFVATGGGVNAPTGACAVNPLTRNTCTCSGAGSCKRTSGAVQFSCDACGVCAATVAGTNKFTTTGAFISPSGSCSPVSGTQVSCLNSADGTFSLASCNVNETIKSLPATGGLLPLWFTANNWEKYIVYAISNECSSTGTCASATSPPKLTVGLNQNVNAIVASSIVNPNGSCSITSYLSDPENTNVMISNGSQDSIYQKTKPKTQTNTDQAVVVTQ